VLKRLVVCAALTAAVAYADTGDRDYLHHGVLDQAAFDAAARNAASWRERAPGFENPDLAMAAETVDITLDAEQARVTATFDFVNTSSASRAVEMCFPVTYGMLGIKDRVAPDDELDLAGQKVTLEVTVDGAAVSYRLEDTRDSAVWVPALATWRVDFDGGGTRRVVCRYADDYNAGGASLNYNFAYILYTGATWKGPIGKGTITVRPGEGFDWSVPLYYLGAGVPPARDEGDRIVWAFENLEPAWTDPSGIPAGSQYYRARLRSLEGAAVTVGFATPAARAETFTGLIYNADDVAYAPPAGAGAAAGVIADNLPLLTAAAPDAPPVAGKEMLRRNEGIAVLERRGEWYRVRVTGGAEGWVRWRSVDPTTGTEAVNVELILYTE